MWPVQNLYRTDFRSRSGWRGLGVFVWSRITSTGDTNDRCNHKHRRNRPSAINTADQVSALDDDTPYGQAPCNRWTAFGTVRSSPASCQNGTCPRHVGTRAPVARRAALNGKGPPRRRPSCVSKAAQHVCSKTRAGLTSCRPYRPCRACHHRQLRLLSAACRQPWLRL